MFAFRFALLYQLRTKISREGTAPKRSQYSTRAQNMAATAKWTIANRLVDYINDVILTGRLGTKPTVVNTKWPWHLSILPWIPDRLLLFIHVFVLRIVQSTSTNLSRGFYMIKPASRKAMVSNTTNIEVCDRHTRHR